MRPVILPTDDVPDDRPSAEVVGSWEGAQPPSPQAERPELPERPERPELVEQPEQPELPTPVQPPTATGTNAGQAVGVDVPGIGAIVPMTRQQVRAFDARTSELSDQLVSAQRRRDDLVEELEEATSPTVREGLEARIQQLDGRLLRIEQDIAANGELKSSIAAKLGTVSNDPPRPPGPYVQRSFFDSTPAMLMMAVVGVAAARYLWRRARVPAPAAVAAQSEARYQALEQAIDSVAIEVERVSEGQRFMAKLLREGQPIPDFVAGRASDAAPIRVSGEGSR